MLYELFYIVVYVIIKIMKMRQSYSLENMNIFKNNTNVLNFKFDNSGQKILKL